MRIKYFLLLLVCAIFTRNSHAQSFPVAERAQKVQRFSSSLTSDDVSTRQDAIAQLKSIYQSVTPMEQMDISHAVEPTILSVLKSPPTLRENWLGGSTSRNLAIKLAGQFKVSSSIPLLIQSLCPMEGQTSVMLRSPFDGQSTEESNVEIAPAARALVQLGSQAIPMVKEALIESERRLSDKSIKLSKKESKNEFIKWSNLKYVLRRLEGTSN